MRMVHAVMGVLLLASGAVSASGDAAYTSAFDVDRADLASTGRNPWFVLEPGYRLVLEHGGARLVITVLAETRRIDGVETRVVEERESRGGRLTEVSRNYFAISRLTNSVYYFGEDVDEYEGGKVSGHEGGWHAGEKGARFGLMMPGVPLLGARYQQELAPGEAMDRAEITSLSDSLTTPAGRFRGVLRTVETTPLEPREREFKYYARGIGLLKDEDLVLVSHGRGR